MSTVIAPEPAPGLITRIATRARTTAVSIGVDAVINTALNASIHTTKELADIQLDIVRHMVLNPNLPESRPGFSYYVTQMQEIGDRIDKIMRNEEMILRENDYFDDLFETKVDSVWWRKESPWLSKLYDSGGALEQFTVVQGLSKQIISQKPDIIKDLLNGMSHLPPQLRLVLTTVLTEYFSNPLALWPVALNMEYTTRLFKDPRTAPKVPKDCVAPLRKSENLLAAAALTGMGPIGIKLMQQVKSGEDAVLPNGAPVRCLLAAVEKAVPPMPPKVYEFVLNNLAVSKVYVNKMHPEPMGSASIAEPHKTTSPWGNEVAFKFMKPVYAYYFLCECNMLLVNVWKKLAKLAPDDRVLMQARQVLLFMVNNFIGEFNYTDEANYTVAGRKLYARPATIDQVDSIFLVEQTVDPFPAIVTEIAAGKPLADWLDTASDLSPKLLHQTHASLRLLYTYFFEAALLGSGFFHADLHGGNLFVDDTGKITVIDYGSSGQLSKANQCGLIYATLTFSKLYSLNLIIPVVHKLEQPRPGGTQGSAAPYFKALWPYLSDDSRAAMNTWFKTKAIQKKHTQNIKNVRVLTDQLNVLCTITVPYIIAPELLLQYTSQLQFDMVFLQFISGAPSLGSCGYGNLLLFGRAMSFINNAVKKVEDIANPTDGITITNALMSAIMKRNKTRGLQIVTGTMKCS